MWWRGAYQCHFHQCTIVIINIGVALFIIVFATKDYQWWWEQPGEDGYLQFHWQLSLLWSSWSPGLLSSLGVGVGAASPCSHDLAGTWRLESNMDFKFFWSFVTCHHSLQPVSCSIVVNRGSCWAPSMQQQASTPSTYPSPSLLIPTTTPSDHDDGGYYHHPQW